MQSTTTFGAFLVATLSASWAQGAVVPQAKPAGSFEVKRVANPNFGVKNGAAALAKAYNKYGIQIPEYVSQAASSFDMVRRDAGNVTTTPAESDLEWLTPVQIGTPAQTLNLDFDTGSSDLWVFSSETPSSQSSSHDIYTPSDSSTSKKMTGASWSIQYGDGSTSSGDVYTDLVAVGSVSYDSQAVESAKKVSSQFASGQNDGLLGLAFSTLNTVKPTSQKTFFDNIAPNLDSNLFVADLRHSAPGSYYFGEIPSAASNIMYAPVDTSNGWWEFSTQSEGTSYSAIADTGTTLIMVENSIVKSYYSKVDGATNSVALGGYVFDCDADLPDFTFTVDGSDFTVPGSLINYGKASSAGTKCYGGIQSNAGAGVNILGDIALKAAYVIFDNGNTQIGWAAKSD